MVWKVLLVDVDGTAVAKKCWVSEPDAPRTLQEACLGPSTTARDIYSVKNRVTPFPFGQPSSQPPPMTFNPVNADYSYMRYAAALGAGGDVCGWSEADRVPDLVHSRESSPASSVSSYSFSCFSPASPASSYTSYSSAPSSPAPKRQRVSSYQKPNDHTSSNLVYSNSNFYSASHNRPKGSWHSDRSDPENDIAFQAIELHESFINPFTNQEYYEEV